MINAIKFSIEETEASDQYFDHTRSHSHTKIGRNPIWEQWDELPGIDKHEFSFLNEDLMVQVKRVSIFLFVAEKQSSTRRKRFKAWKILILTQRRSNMKKFLTTLAVLTVVATPVFAQTQGSQHRAEAIKSCTEKANAEYGPSGMTSMRRSNHDVYAACMKDKGEAE